MIPGEVLALLQDTPAAELPGLPAGERSCQGAKFHSPRPMVVHPFQVDEDHVIHLCGTCADNVEVLLALLRAHRGDVPWTVRRCFGNLVRLTAEQTHAKENHA